MKIIYLLISFIISSANASICERTYQNFGDISLKTAAFASGDCYISISSMSARNLVYRYHLFISDGQHMVFNSYGAGPSRYDTGARVFSYFPRLESLDYSVSGDELTIKLVDGNSIVFDTKTSLIKRSIGFDIREESLIHPQNDGGVEIKSSQHTFVDFGYRQGASPMTRLSANHKIVRPFKTCLSKNSNALKAVGDEVEWLFKSNQEFENYFDTHCNEN